MRSFSSQEEEEEEDRFFDTQEDITSVSDSGSDCPDNVDFGSNSTPGNVDWVSSSLQYDVWIKKPDSVNERRDKFLKWLGMSSDQQSRNDDSGNQSRVELLVEIDRIKDDSGAVLANSDCEDVLSSSRSSRSCSSCDTRNSSEGGASEVSFVYRIKNLDDGTEFIVDQLGHDGMLSRLREVGSNRLLSLEEFQNSLGLTPLVQHVQREADAETDISPRTTKRVKNGWLRRLGIAACIVDGQHGGDGVEPNDSGVSRVARVQRVRVRSYKKRSKELSALYMGQEIQAHEGSIQSMKFSPDGCYLASAGEDRIVRVWKVMESERLNDIDIPDFDPSSLYFMANRYSELASLSSDKEKVGKFKGPRRTSDKACAIFPPRVFRLSEKPVHEFQGHSGEILDLCWSKNKYLLSSSVDKTVRLWRVGCDQCLRVFSHNNYVTCIQFNPVNDNYFISGSIDGKVRIWDVRGCHVIDWTDIKEIVTAVCYQPDGKGGIVGSMAGNCRFYDVTDNRLQLDAQIYLQGKKKSPGKRITGFQFSPSDPSKLMVTSADSQVRILNGVDVICKYKGLRNAGSQISATFTIDGKHIVSASEDSNVYVWNYKCQDGPAPSEKKSIWSRERFFSGNVSVAMPWCGMKDENPAISTLGTHLSHKISGGSPRNSENGWHHYHLNDSHNALPLSTPDCVSLNQGFFSEALPKGTATWPEEKLPTSNSMDVSSVVCKTQYKFLKSCYQSTSPSHAWGMVIVTGGWDGRIRSFHNYGLPVHT